MNRNSIALSIIASFLIAGTVSGGTGGGIGLRAWADRKSVFIGDKIRYTVEVNSAKDIELSFPKFEGKKIGVFEIKDTASKVKGHLFGGRTISNIYYISAFSTGEQIIPQIEIRYRKKGQAAWETKKTAAMTVMVNSVLPKELSGLDIKDIKGPLSFHESRVILILLTSLLILILFLSVMAAYRRKKKVPPKPAHETALEELEAIRSLFMRMGDIKEYYIGISDCVRRYIESTLRLRAPEMTTEEFLNSLGYSQSLSPEEKDLLKNFLQACDLVKFAKRIPHKSEIESVYITAKAFVEKTKSAYSHKVG